jgi:Cu2+-containing amine oxidase
VDEPVGPEVRRARRLVVSFHVTVANYEYLVYWRFHQDGNIECEVRATGIMVTSLFPNGRGRPRYGTLVDEHTYAPLKVVNDSVRNDLGTPVGYKLVPSGAFPPLLDRSSRPSGGRR